MEEDEILSYMKEKINKFMESHFVREDNLDLLEYVLEYTLGSKMFFAILAAFQDEDEDKRIIRIPSSLALTEIVMLTLFQLYLTEKQEKIIIFSNE